MASRATCDPGRAARLLAPGDPDGVDLARRLPPAVPADRRADRLRHRPARAGPRRPRPHHPMPPGRDAGGAATTIAQRWRTRAPAGGTGLKLCGAGEWLLEKHGTKPRRSWRKLHIGMDAETGQIVASTLTTHDVDDGPQVGPLLDQVAGPLASFTGDGAYDQDGVTI